MNWLTVIAGVCWLVLVTGCGPKENAVVPDLSQPSIVEAGCGRCLFARKEDKKCNLAIRVNNQSYFVDGFALRDFGDPDIAGGMCQKVHQARVSGAVIKRRFTAGTFELLPLVNN